MEVSDFKVYGVLNLEHENRIFERSARVRDTR